MKRGFFRYRNSGNCFAVCVVNACQTLNDKTLLSSPTPELIIFSAEVLLGHEDKEIEPAYRYLKKHNYQVKIFDKNTKNGNLFGESLNKRDVTEKSYTIDDISELSKKGWAVIASVLDQKGSRKHGILVCKNYIYNPLNESSWIKGKELNFLKKLIPKDDSRWLIAFKLKGLVTNINHLDNIIELSKHTLPKAVIFTLLYLGFASKQPIDKLHFLIASGLFSGLYHGLYTNILWKSPKRPLHLEYKDIPFVLNKVWSHTLCGFLASIGLYLLSNRLNLSEPLKTLNELRLSDFVVFIVVLTGYIGLLPRALWFWSYSGKLRD